MRFKVASLEVRARIATLIFRGFGWILILTGILLIIIGVVSPQDRLGPIVGALVSIGFGVAFLVAKPMTAEHLMSGIGDL